MNDLFETKNIKPMLIGQEGKAFDSKDYIYELKLDGERCIAYLDPDKGTELRNKRNVKMLPKVPELSEIHRQVSCRCILDGELAVIRDGRPDFSEIQRRSLMASPMKIELASKQSPACFTAFDILYFEDHSVNLLPMTERKKLLDQAVISESARFAKSRYIEEKGIAFYNLAEQRDLEGIVAKRKDSLYYFDKRTKDWIKCKNLKDEDFVVCGYIPKENHMTSLVLGQYENGSMVYRGHVKLGVGGENFRRIKAIPVRNSPPFAVPSEKNENAVWIAPLLVCTVKYMEKTEHGGMRQPVFKGLRNDKTPEELAEIWRLLSESPTEFKGGGIWSVMVDINGALKAVGYALLVLFFLVGIMRQFNSFQEIKRPEQALKLFIRFVLAKAAVTWGLDLMMAMFTIVQGMISKIMTASGIGGTEGIHLPQNMIETIESCGFWESIPLWAVTLIGGLLVWVLSFVMILTVYGRFFRLYIYTAISPIPLSTFAGEETSHIGKSFVRSFAAVCLEGAVIVLACIIYSLFAMSPPSVPADASAVTQVWTYIGELLFNMLVLVGTIKLSDRVVKDMMGL